MWRDRNRITLDDISLKVRTPAEHRRALRKLARVKRANKRRNVQMAREGRAWKCPNCGTWCFDAGLQLLHAKRQVC